MLPDPRILVTVYIYTIWSLQSLLPGQQVLQEVSVPIQDVHIVVAVVSNKNVAGIVCTYTTGIEGFVVILSSVLISKFVVLVQC